MPRAAQMDSVKMCEVASRRAERRLSAVARAAWMLSVSCKSSYTAQARCVGEACSGRLRSEFIVSIALIIERV